MKSFDNNIQNLKARLMSQVGYKRLTDTYNTDEFRMATFESGLNVDPIKSLSAGQFEIKFNCKPQRWLTSGESVTTLTTSGSISNPTRFAAKPLIVVTGYGTVKVGSNTITITNNFPSVTIDSELGDCYSGSTHFSASQWMISVLQALLSPGCLTLCIASKPLPPWQGCTANSYLSAAVLVFGPSRLVCFSPGPVRFIPFTDSSSLSYS